MKIVPLEIATIGAHVRWHIEEERGVIPRSNFTQLVGVSSAPAIALSPETVDVSNLADRIVQHMPGRLDPGTDAQFMLNHSDEAIKSWNDLVSAANLAHKQKKRIWFEYAYRNAKLSYYFCGYPLPLGNDGIEQNSLSRIAAHVIPYGKPRWDDRSVYDVIYIGTNGKFYVGTNNKAYSGFDPDYEERMWQNGIN